MCLWRCVASCWRRGVAEAALRSAEGGSTVEQDLGLDDLPVPDARCVATFPERLLFGSGKSVIVPASSEPIEALSKVMLEVPGMKVAVVGHADGQEHDRVLLSRARATAVVDRLVARDVASDRLSVVARGAEAPIVLDGTRGRPRGQPSRRLHRHRLRRNGAPAAWAFVGTYKQSLPSGRCGGPCERQCDEGGAGRREFGRRGEIGRLAPEVIQAIVRDRYAAMKDCYETGLRSNPNLQGRVSTHFVIDVDGTVSNVSNESSTLPDPQTVRCVLDVFSELCFPSPEGGIVTVVYPIMFSPGD